MTRVDFRYRTAVASVLSATTMSGVDRSSAISRLRAEGFIVSERTWALGDSISVGALPDEHGPIRTLKVLEYLYPAPDDRWCVTDLRNNGAGSEHPDIASAVDHIVRVVRDSIEAIERE